MNFIQSDEVEAIRSRIDHPIIDSDGHLIEYLPLVRDFIVEEAGEDVAQAFDQITHSAAGASGRAVAGGAAPTRHVLRPASGASRRATPSTGRRSCCPS